MDSVPAALPPPSLSELLSRWSPQPVAIAVAVAVAAAYAHAVIQLNRTSDPHADGRRLWPRRRTVAFGLGLALFSWTTCGLPQVYASSLYWMWTSQQLTLLLIVPVILMAGQPLELTRRRRGDRALVLRLADSAAGRLFTNPLVGPVLIPVLSVVLFFGPLSGWAIAHAAIGQPLQVLVVVAGALIVLPLVATGDQRGSMAVGLALTIGVFELLLDAIPGISLRLHTTLVTSFFDHRAAHPWSLTPLHDQQVGGAVLWCVSELIDLPFLLLIYVRWLRADARDAAEIDTVLEAERIAQGRSATDQRPASDQPWWHSDPTMRDRFR